MCVEAAKKAAQEAAKAVTKAAFTAFLARQAKHHEKVAKQLRVNKSWFPNEIMYHLPWKEGENKSNNVVKIRCAPHMTRVEMKNWIELAYDTPVRKVNTMNKEGQIQRCTNPKFGRGYYKRPDFKVAYVFLEQPWDSKQALEDADKE